MATTLEDLAAKLREQDRLFESILYKRQLDTIRSKGLHFLLEKDLQNLATQVRQVASVAEATGGLFDPAAALAKLNNQLEQGPLPPKARGELEQKYGQLAELLRRVSNQATGVRGQGTVVRRWKNNLPVFRNWNRAISRPKMAAWDSCCSALRMSPASSPAAARP